MSNALLNYKNWIDTEYADSAVSVAALSAQTSYPVANVRAAVNAQLSNPHRAKKSAGRYGGYAIDLGTARSVRTASLHRLVSSTVRGRFRVQAANTDVLGNPAIRLDLLETTTDGRTYPNTLDSRVTVSRASGGTCWRDGQLFGLELVTVSATALTTSQTTWTVRAGGKWQTGDPVYVLPQDGTANISLTATVSNYSGTTLTLTSVTAGSDTTTTKTAFLIAYRGPRLDSHPVTKVRRGYFTETARANVATNSEDSSTDHIDNGWQRDSVTRTGDAATTPDGASTATLMTASGGSATHGFNIRRGSISSPYDSVISVFVKAKGTHLVELYNQADSVAHGYSMRVNLRTGAVVSTTQLGSGTLNGTFVEELPDDWYRIGISVNHTSAAAAAGVIGRVRLVGLNGSTTFTPDATEAESCYVWGWQIEVNGLKPTSYIWAGSAARSRSGDVASATGTDFSDWWDGDGQVTIGTAFERIAHSDETAYVVNLSDGSSDTIAVYQVATALGDLYSQAVDGGSSQCILTPSMFGPDVTRAAFALGADDFAAVTNGGTVTTDTSGSMPVVDRLYIGCTPAGAFQLDGWIREITIWNRRLANARIQAWTGRGAVLNTDFAAVSTTLPLYWTFSRSAGGTYTDAYGTTSGSYDFTAASQTAGTGSKTFPVGAGLDIKVGQVVEIVPQDATANVKMIGAVTAYSGAYATVNVLETGSDRSTAKTAWTMGLLGSRIDYSSGTALGILLESTDTLTLSGDEFTARWRSDAMTIVVEGVAPASLSGTQTLLSADDGTANERIEIVSSSGTLQLVVVDGGVSQAGINLGTLTASTAFRVAVRIKANDLSGSLDGAAVVTDTSATLPTVTTLRLGKDQAGGDAWGGHVGRAILRREADANADLVAMATAGVDLSDYTLPGTLADAYAGDVDTDWLLNRRSYGTGDLPEGVTEFTRYAWSAAQSYRYWRVDMVEPLAPDSDPPTADDGLALDVGYLGIWHGYQFTRNPAYGAVRGFRSNSQEQRALGGARIVDRRGTPRTWALQFDAQDETDADALEDATAFLDKDLPCLLVLDPSDNSGFFRTDKLGQQVSLGNREYATFGLYRTAIGVEEIVG